MIFVCVYVLIFFRPYPEMLGGREHHVVSGIEPEPQAYKAYTLSPLNDIFSNVFHLGAYVIHCC